MKKLILFLIYFSFGTSIIYGSDGVAILTRSIGSLFATGFIITAIRTYYYGKANLNKSIYNFKKKSLFFAKDILIWSASFFVSFHIPFLNDPSSMFHHIVKSTIVFLLINSTLDLIILFKGRIDFNKNKKTIFFLLILNIAFSFLLACIYGMPSLL